MRPVSFFVMRKTGEGAMAARLVLPHPCTACRSMWLGRCLSGLEATTSLNGLTLGRCAVRPPPRGERLVEEGAEGKGFRGVPSGDARAVPVEVFPSAGGEGTDAGMREGGWSTGWVLQFRVNDG